MTATELIAKLEELGEQFSHVPLVLRAEQGELLILVEFGNVHSGILGTQGGADMGRGVGSLAWISIEIPNG